MHRQTEDGAMPGRVVVSTPANGRQRWDAPAVGKVKNAYGSRDQPGEAFGDSVRWAGGGKVKGARSEGCPDNFGWGVVMVMVESGLGKKF